MIKLFIFVKMKHLYPTEHPYFRKNTRTIRSFAHDKILQGNFYSLYFTYRAAHIIRGFLTW